MFDDSWLPVNLGGLVHGTGFRDVLSRVTILGAVAELGKTIRGNAALV
jgi:hypothetical protein